MKKGSMKESQGKTSETTKVEEKSQYFEKDSVLESTLKWADSNSAPLHFETLRNIEAEKIRDFSMKRNSNEAFGLDTTYEEFSDWIEENGSIREKSNKSPNFFSEKSLSERYFPNASRDYEKVNYKHVLKSSVISNPTELLLFLNRRQAGQSMAFQSSMNISLAFRNQPAK